MNPESVYHALSTLLSILIGCYLFFWQYRKYRVDLFRQRVFALRDSLFDEADKGLIEFDDPAYGMLRSMMNGYIRFGHRLNLWFLLSMVVFTWGLDLDSAFEKRFVEAVSKLEPEVQERLAYYHSEMSRLAIKHVLTASPEAYIIAIPLFVLLILVLAVRQLFVRARRARSMVLASAFKTIDDTALVYGAET